MYGNPLVSVIIVVKNGERFLAEAIHSVVAQDYGPLEIVVVDGHSTDRTVQIAQSFAQVRTKIQESAGVSDAYNCGIETSQGEILAFLSHDDLWVPDKLTTQVDYLLENPDVPFCTAKASFFLEPGCAIPVGFREELLQGEHVAHIMETLVVRRRLFDSVGWFDTRLSTAEDVDWFARANDQGFAPIAIPKVLVHKRVHDANISLDAGNNRNILRALRSSIDRKRVI